MSLKMLFIEIYTFKVIESNTVKSYLNYILRLSQYDFYLRGKVTND